MMLPPRYIVGSHNEPLSIFQAQKAVARAFNVWPHSNEIEVATDAPVGRFFVVDLHAIREAQEDGLTEDQMARDHGGWLKWLS